MERIAGKNRARFYGNSKENARHLLATNLNQWRFRDLRLVGLCFRLATIMDNLNNNEPKVTNEDKKESSRVEQFKLPLDIVSIGVVESIFNKKNGTPRQSGICPESKGIIRIHKQLFNNPVHPIEGIEQFQYLWIIFYFHQNHNKRRFIAKVHPPRLNGSSCGVFASRSPHRPNPIGLSIVKLDHVKDGALHVSGLDMINETPVIDIKPFIERYDCPQPPISTNLQGDGSPNEKPGIKDVKKNEESPIPLTEKSWIDGGLVDEVQVDFTPKSLKQLSQFHHRSLHESNGVILESCDKCFRLFHDENQAKQAIINLLKADPRSVYRRKKCLDRLYFFTIDTIHITAWFDIETNLVEVIKIKPYKMDR